MKLTVKFVKTVFVYSKMNINYPFEVYIYYGLKYLNENEEVVYSKWPICFTKIHLLVPYEISVNDTEPL